MRRIYLIVVFLLILVAMLATPQMMAFADFSINSSTILKRTSVKEKISAGPYIPKQIISQLQIPFEQAGIDNRKSFTFLVDSSTPNGFVMPQSAQLVTNESRNLLYNSSFELATNPDIPDGWTRDLAKPPWGEDVYVLDNTTSFHGSKSVRIGYKGKYVRSWGRRRHIYLVEGKEYVFSAYLKASSHGVKARLELSGVASAYVTVTPEWKRYWVAGIAKTKETMSYVHLESEGVLWVDATQLELGLEPTEYVPMPDDLKSVVESTVNSKKLGSLAGLEDTTSKANIHRDADISMDFVGTEFDFYTDDVEARARFFMALPAKDCSKAKLKWWVEKQGEPVVGLGELRPLYGINEWTFDIKKLTYGYYTLRASLEVPGQAIIQKNAPFRKLPPGYQEVRINRWGRFLVVNGKPFFWYGFYDSLNGRTADESTAAFRAMQGVHSTGIMNYIGFRTEYEMVGWALDQAHKHNLKMWVHLGWMLSYHLPKYQTRKDRYSNDAEAMAALSDIVTKYRNHPALLGWVTLDEPGNRPTIFTKDFVEKAYSFIKQLDPYHPCIFSHLTRLGESRIYATATDIAVIPYTDNEISNDLFYEFWNFGLPVVTNSPCFGALGITRREPTAQEQRVRMYKALIMGARGLCSYTFRCNSEYTWREFGRVGRELQMLAPILLTPDDKLRINIEPVGSSVRALLKVYKARTYLIAVNSDSDAVKTIYYLLDARSVRTAKPLFASPPPAIDSKTKTLTVTMPSMSVAIYEIE